MKPTSLRAQQRSCAAACARGTLGVRSEEKSEQVSRVRPDGHPMHIESSADGDHALAVRSGSSNSVYLAVRQGCSSSSPRFRHDARLTLGVTVRLVFDTEFRLLPRGTQPLEPLPGVRFESGRVHNVMSRDMGDI